VLLPGRRVGDLREGLLQRCTAGRQGQQPATWRDGLDDQPLSFLSDDGLGAFELELARNPDRLIASIAEPGNMAFAADGGLRIMHMPKPMLIRNSSPIEPGVGPADRNPAHRGLAALGLRAVGGDLLAEHRE